MATPQVSTPSISTHSSFVAQPQGRTYARSLSTLARPVAVVNRQSLPVRVGDALSQTQRPRRAVAAAQVSTGQRWRSPPARDPQPQQGQSVKVVKARPAGVASTGGVSTSPGHAFSGSGFASTGGVMGTVAGLLRDPATSDDELSRTWRALAVSAARTPVPPLAGPRRDKAATPTAAPGQSQSQSETVNSGREMPVAFSAAKVPALSGTWRSVVPQEDGLSNTIKSLNAPIVAAAPVIAQEPQRVVRPFMPPQRTARRHSASPERSVPVVRPGSHVQPQIICHSPQSAIAAKVLTVNGHREGRSPAPQIKSGSWVAERPSAQIQDTRQTASFTAMPMYKWGASVPAARPTLRMRLVFGAHTQAGHKMRSPGCPNQDCHLVVPLSPGVCLAAVFDGHGAHGHLVSQFVRGVFERFANSLALLPATDLPEGMIKVFNLAQESLEREGLAEMAGTTATVALIDSNSGVLTVAHVGDSTLCTFVGYNVSYKTKDHVVDDEAERYVRGKGGVVRASTFDGVTAKRIYHKGEDSAGLGMSRALGHTELQPLVLTTPEVSTAQFGPGSTLVIASDGIWEKMPPEMVAEVIAANPPTMTSGQASNLSRTLVAEARKRWHGDIDDITAVVVRAVPDISGGSFTAPANS